MTEPFTDNGYIDYCLLVLSFEFDLNFIKNYIDFLRT